MLGIAQVLGRHHRCKVSSNGLAGSTVGDAAQPLVFACVEHMQDRADQQRVTGLLPVVALLQRTFGDRRDIGDVLHVAHLMRAAPNSSSGL